jgi:RsiW-degrading membrane proteinase PrsW (M82 family)
MVTIISLLIASSIPLACLFAIYKLDTYRTGERVVVGICFGWGLVAYFIAAQLNPAMIHWGIFERNMVLRFVGPALEETLKCLILLFIVRRAKFTYFVDGAIYGFAIGIGFAVVENWEYILGNPQSALFLAIGRVLSTNLIHATGSALIGTALGYARFDRSARRLLFLAIGVILAIGLHIGFNNLVTRVQGGIVLLYAAIVGFGGTGLIVWLIRRGLGDEKVWIEEKLGAADRVTRGEAALVQHLEKVDDLLAPLAQRFGPKKAKQIEEFLVLQARLGINRMSIEKHTDEKMRAALEKQVADLQLKMDAARREVGIYCMMYVRQIFPEGNSPLWGKLQAIIDERIASGAPRSGASLWDSLDKRARNTPGESGNE